MANFCNVKKIAMEERLFNELLTTILTEISTRVSQIVLRLREHRMQLSYIRQLITTGKQHRVMLMKQAQY